MEGRAMGQLRARRRLADERGVVEMLRERAELLQRRDKALALMYLECGASYRHIAEVAGVNEVTVARRMRRIIRRLLKWDYVRLAREKGLTAMEARAAKDVVVGGLGQREVAARLGCTRHAVIKAVMRAEGMAGRRLRRRCRQEKERR